jgi:hypothetical protein
MFSRRRVSKKAHSRLHVRLLVSWLSIKASLVAVCACPSVRHYNDNRLKTHRNATHVHRLTNSQSDQSGLIRLIALDCSKTILRPYLVVIIAISSVKFCAF